MATSKRSPSAGAHGQGEMTRLIALTVPGLGGLLAEELGSMGGAQVADTGKDGRAEVVRLVARARGPALREVRAARLAEDLFIELGLALRSDGDQAQLIADRLWRPDRVQQALAAHARLAGPVSRRPTFRVIARVLQERSFLRTDLRRSVADAIARRQPRWRFADPADIEVWVVEYQPGTIIAGLRVSAASMRQHGGRGIERAGALRPVVAAAMVRLAGKPGGVLLDACCGSGTILAEAAAAGWRCAGVDIDPGAVRIAGKNAGAFVHRGDIRQLAFADHRAGACVSNLPFGKQYTVPQDMDRWVRDALAELTRVTEHGGRVVLLAPRLPRQCLPASLTIARRVPMRLLGTATTIWAFDRR